MRRYWGHAAMLLLGISLTVGFYEGRALVQNTAKALSAATTITASGPTRRERRRDVERDEVGSADEVREAGAQPERKRRNRRMVPIGGTEVQPMLAPTYGPHTAALRERIDLARPPRIRGRPMRKPVEVEPEEVLDTGVVDPSP